MLPFQWRKLSGKTFPFRASRSGRTGIPSRRAKPHTILELEYLEPRLVPSVTAVQDPTTGILTVTTAGNELAVIYGTCTTSTVGDVTVCGTGLSATAFTNVNGIFVNSTAPNGQILFDDNGGANSAVDLGTTAGRDITIDGAGGAFFDLQLRQNGTTALTAGGFNETGVTGVVPGVVLTDAVLTTGSDGINFNDDVGVFLSGASLTSTGPVSFNSTVKASSTNAADLTVNGNVVFNGNVGDGTPLGNLTVNGDATLNAVNFTTNNTQTFNGPVLLKQGVTLNAKGTNVTFTNTVDSFNSTAQNLTVDGNAIFQGNVGISNQISTLTVGNTATVNSGTASALINTTGDQIYCGPVNVNSTVSFNSTGGNITFDSTLNGGNAVTVDAGGRNATFSNTVGNATTPLASLTVETHNIAVVNASVTTSGAQIYCNAAGANATNTAVNVTNTAVFNSTNSGVTFNSTLTLGCATTLIANTVTFDGNVTGNSTNLTVNGTANIDAPSINTGAGSTQTYCSAVNLGCSATLSGSVTFDGNVNLGTNQLDLDQGNDAFNSATTLTATLSNATSYGNIALTNSTTLNLASASLNLSSSFTYPVNSSVSLLGTNDTNSSITGNFTGSSVTAGCSVFKISYPNGNEVLLTAISIPTIQSISPSTGASTGGTSITITGSMFAAGATVTIGGASATDIVVVNSTKITAVTPAGTAGAADVVVTNMDGGTITSPGGFTYVDESDEITGTVFTDLKANGQLDAGDPGIAGRTIFIDLNNSGTFQTGDPSAVSDTSGNYTFSNLSSGNYTIRLQIYPGDQPTQPSQGVTQITLVAGVKQVVNFGLQKDNPLFIVKPNPQPFGSGNPNVTTAQIKSFYELILGRSGSAAEVGFWVNKVASGEMLQEVVTQFYQSTEFYTDQVNRLYQTDLHRQGDANGVQYWIGLLQSGENISQISVGFLTSAEFNGDHADNTDFLQTLYKNVLGRASDAGGLATWLTNLQRGADRSTIVQGFVFSREAYQLAVNGFYTGFLNRLADAQGEAYWLNQLESNSMTLVQIALGLLLSQEMQNRATMTVS